MTKLITAVAPLPNIELRPVKLPTETCSIRLPKATLDAVRAYAEKNRATISSVFGRAVTDYLQREMARP